jgi:Glycosyl transferase family 2
MKLVMTLLARNEADIVDAQIAFHLHAGVDFVIATDNRSDDGTTEILERYERAGHLRLLHEGGDDMQQQEWVTRMARLAATEHGADWVINTDADEFWWPRGGTLKEVLELVPERFGVVRGCWRHFLPRPEGDQFFAERMTVRLARPSFAGDKRTIFHAHQKVAHRARPDVVVEAGNHYARGTGLHPLRGWYPIEVMHFSIRSVAQLVRKSEGGWSRNESYVLAPHQRHLDEAAHARDVARYFESFVVGDQRLAAGLADGSLATDVRLRDALRSLRHGSDAGSPPEFALPDLSSVPALGFPKADVEEDTAYASETSALVDLDGVVRAEARVAAVGSRIEALERASLSRLISRSTRGLLS